VRLPPLLLVITTGFPLVKVDELLRLILPVLLRLALPTRLKVAPVKFIVPPESLVYNDPLPLVNDVPALAVIVPAFSSPAVAPKPILPDVVNEIVAPLLFVTTVVKELGLAMDIEALVNARLPLLIRRPGVEPELIVNVPEKFIVLPVPIVSVVVLNTVEAPQAVVPLPFHVRFEPVCTEIPPVIVLPVAFVVKVLFPPGLVGVCNVPLTARVPFKVNVEVDKLTFAAVIVPLTFELSIPLVTVIVFVTDSGAFTVSVDAVTLLMVSDEQLALALIVGWLPENDTTPICTLSEAVGTAPADQLLPMFQDVEVEPTQFIVAALIICVEKIRIKNPNNSDLVFN
jgi:hypothetical protein